MKGCKLCEFGVDHYESRPFEGTLNEKIADHYTDHFHKYTGKFFTCWCGEKFLLSSGNPWHKVHKHIKKNGGILNHWTDHVMGIRDES